jgi:hypothetical protein
VLVAVGTTVLCTVLGNGLRPPVVSSVDPMGTPTRPAPEREPLPGEEADAAGLADAVVPPAQVAEAAPDTPALSKREVGADVPPIALLVPAIEVPGLAFPDVEVVGCADAPILEHVPVAIEPRGEVPAAVGLTPGVAISVAPSGIPVTPMGAPGPIPSGEVTPSELGAAVPVPTWANAGLQHNKGQAAATIKKCLMKDSRCELSYPM